MNKKGFLKLVVGGVVKYILGKILKEVDTSIFTSWDVYYCSECKTFHAFVKPGVCPFCYGTTKIFAIPTFEANTSLFR